MPDPDEFVQPYRNPLTEGQRPVEVGVHNLTEYVGHMFKIFLNNLTPTAKAFGDMPMQLTEGLTSVVDGVAPLAEGKMAHQMMQRRIEDFQSFFTDMNEGIRAIANAAQVVAYCFDNTDGENGATIGQVAFAFGYEGSTMPNGFDTRLLYNETVTTMDDLRSSGSGEYAGSNAGLYGDRDGASLAYTNPYASKWEWPDGSYMTASYHTDHSGAVPVYVTTYTVYDKAGNVVGTRTERGSYNSDGRVETDSVEIASGDGAGVRTDTRTDHSSGHVTTTTTTTLPDGDDADDRPDTSTTTHEASPGAHSTNPSEIEPGPVEDAMDTYGTHGGLDTQRQYGMDY